MNIKTMSATGLTVVALLAAFAGSAAADPGTQCDVPQRQVLRLALSIAVGQTALDKPTITGVIERLWAPEGFDFDWIDETRAATDDQLDAWIVVGRRSAESAKAPRREDGLSRRIWVSADEVAAHLEQRLALHLQVPHDSARHLMFGGGHPMERALGYAIAHKLGHSVMGLPHSHSGLMSANYNFASRGSVASAAQLDAASRKLLQKRFTVGCEAR